MSNIEVRVKGEFRSAKAVRSGRDLAVSHEGGYSKFVVPSLAEYELVELN